MTTHCSPSKSLCPGTIARIIGIRLMHRRHHTCMTGSLWEAICTLCSLNSSLVCHAHSSSIVLFRVGQLKIKESLRSKSFVFICAIGISRSFRISTSTTKSPGFSIQKLREETYKQEPQKTGKTLQSLPSFFQFPRMTLRHCSQDLRMFVPFSSLHHSGRHCSSHETCSKHLER